MCRYFQQIEKYRGILNYKVHRVYCPDKILLVDEGFNDMDVYRIYKIMYTPGTHFINMN